MHKDGWYFFRTLKPSINCCVKGKKFAEFLMSAKYFRKILVYILIHLIKNARGAAQWARIKIFVNLNLLRLFYIKGGTL